MINQCKLLFSKFTQTGRSLAGICYGGCLFLGSTVGDHHRKNVDYALNYLARDTSEIESLSGQGLDEVWNVIDSLLSCLSLVIS